ncbi:MAG: Gmad2 immunoglobulin-like domain-containing protein [bacterium]
MKKILIVILLVAVVGALAWFLFSQKQDKEEVVVPNPNTTTTLANQYSDLIKVDSPNPNQVIQSPFTITGQARGGWYFEATFPVALLDLSGNTITSTFAQAQGDWMVENFVPFKSILNFKIATTTQPAILVLMNDNPSGLPENEKEIRIPVVLQNPSASLEQRDIKLYYYNPNLDNIACSEKGLVGVERQIPLTQTPIQDAIKLLLKGELTSQEKAQGITTEYPLPGFVLQGASLNNKVLTLDFNDPNNKTGGGSCRVSILWNQIEATAKQFPEVSEVKFIPEELFQP